MPSSTFVLTLRIRTKYQISKSLSERGIDKTCIVFISKLAFYLSLNTILYFVRSAHLLHYKVFGYKDVIKCAE